MEYNGVLDLLKAAVARSGIETSGSGVYSTRRKVYVQVRSARRPASGLGSSAALGVAAIGALAATTTATCSRTRSPASRSSWRPRT